MATLEEVRARAAAWEAAKHARNPRDRPNYTERARLRLAAGIHPVAEVGLHPNGETCGSCFHAIVFERANRHWTCELFDTRSEASDIRKKWPACIYWEERVAT